MFASVNNLKSLCNSFSLMNRCAQQANQFESVSVVKENKPDSFDSRSYDSVTLSADCKDEKSHCFLNMEALKKNCSRLSDAANDVVSHILPQPTERNTGGRITITGTKWNDHVKLHQNSDGSLQVKFNGKEKQYSAEEAHKLCFDLKQGNNRFSVDDSVTYSLHIRAGNGNNRIQSGSGADTITVGKGNNTIDTGEAKSTGNEMTKALTLALGGLPRGDRITTGNGNNVIRCGGGNDSITVGSGNNVIHSGDGADSIVAGNGNNTIHAGKKGGVALRGYADIRQREPVYGLRGDSIQVGNGNNIITGSDEDDSIRTGKGNNNIYACGGNDTVIVGGGTNTIYGGDGRDYIQGGDGADTIFGGRGNDVIYGLDGNDKIYGGAGNDYIDGGWGDDMISPGVGNDIVAGGRGSDLITGLSSGNTIISDGLDKIQAKGMSGNKIYHHVPSETETLGRELLINGDNEFRMRLASDLEVLRTLPQGRKMLEELGKAGHTIEIIRLDETIKNGYASSLNLSARYVDEKGKRNIGTDVTIGYNPAYYVTANEHIEKNPLVVLFHEMSHAYNNVTGTMQPGYTSVACSSGAYDEMSLEHQAIGLRVDGPPITHPDGTVTSSNPPDLTENGLRQALGLALRTSY